MVLFRSKCGLSFSEICQSTMYKAANSGKACVTGCVPGIPGCPVYRLLEDVCLSQGLSHGHESRDVSSLFYVNAEKLLILQRSWSLVSEGPRPTQGSFYISTFPHSMTAFNDSKPPRVTESAWNAPWQNVGLPSTQNKPKRTQRTQRIVAAYLHY
jgi:hypothetical protein